MTHADGSIKIFYAPCDAHLHRTVIALSRNCHIKTLRFAQMVTVDYQMKKSSHCSELITLNKALHGSAFNA